MNTYKKPIVMIVISLTIIVIGLFFLCAQQRGKAGSGSDMSADDEAFRQELLQMLDLADSTGQGEQVDEITLPDESEDDVLSLLVPEKADESARGEAATSTGESVSPAAEAAKTATAANMGLSEEMFLKVQNDLDRLEKTLEERSHAVDSLRRIIENRNARIQELENRLKEFRAGKRAAMAMRQQPASHLSVSAGGSSDFMQKYRAARTEFEAYHYQNALQTFQDLLEQYPNHPMADNCQYWIGECYFGMKQYQQAIVEFQKVFAFSQTDKYDDAQLMIGLSYVRSGQSDRAKTEFQTFLDTYAGSEYESIARRYIRNI